MPNQTPNINLTKPLQTENYDVDVFNGNSDIIDTQIGSIKTGYVKKSGDTMTGRLTLSADPASNLEASTKQYADTKLPLSGGAMTGDISGNIAFENAPKTLGFFAGAGYLAMIDFLTSKHILYYDSTLKTLTSDLATININAFTANSLSSPLSIALGGTGLTGGAAPRGYGLGVYNNTNVNINTLAESGLYYSNGTSGTIPTSSGDNSGYLLHQAYSSIFARQTFFAANNSQIFTRALLSGTWSSWSQISTVIASSFGTNGYIRYSNGYTEQWGKITVGDDLYTPITFPIAFSSVFNIQATPTYEASFGGGNSIGAHVGSVSNSGFSLGISSTSTAANGGYWRAVGTS